MEEENGKEAISDLMVTLMNELNNNAGWRIGDSEVRSTLWNPKKDSLKIYLLNGIIIELKSALVKK